MTDLNMSILSGRIFGLDAQLLFDMMVQGIAVFLLFIFLSYVLIEPVRKVLADRQNKIENDIEIAKKEKEEAENFKKQYDEKLKAVEEEANQILYDARKKAKLNENQIIEEANGEASRIISRANTEANLEKEKVKEEVKVEIINVASLMAAKFVEETITESRQAQLIDETLKEMGDETWLGK